MAKVELIKFTKPSLLKISSRHTDLNIRTGHTDKGAYAVFVNEADSSAWYVGNYAPDSSFRVGQGGMQNHEAGIVVSSSRETSFGTDSTGGYRIRVNGNAYGDSWQTASDIRFKKEINTIEDASEKVLGLRGVTYKWKKDEFPKRAFGDEMQYGFIAQEVEEVLPDLVTTGK